MNDKKHFLQSKTIRANIAQILAVMLPTLGLSMEDQHLISQSADTLIMVLCSAYAIYGRCKAEQGLKIK